MNKTRVSVQDSRSTTTFSHDGKSSFTFSKVLAEPSTGRAVDTNACFWDVAFIKLSAGQILVKVGGDMVPLPEGSHVLFRPPFTIIEWHLRGVSGEIFAYCSHGPCPEDLRRLEPFAFASSATIPGTFSEALAEVRLARDRIGVSRNPTPRPFARRIKQIIDADFRGSCQISAVAERLKSDPARVSRAFSADFGVTPLYYRNRMRVTEALRSLISPGASVTAAALESGFEDMSRFQKVFKEQTGSSPSKFLPSHQQVENV